MNVFIVSSPFQYICANEARVFFSTKNNILVLKTKQTLVGKKQFDSIIDESVWDYVIKQPDSGRIIAIPKTIKEIKKITNKNNSKLNCLFFSQYKCMLTNLMKRNLTFDKQVYFDDGIQTLKEYSEYIKNKTTYTRYRFLDDIFIQLQGLNKIGSLIYNEKLEIFSIFNIPNPTCKLHLNQLTALRKNINAKMHFNANSPVGFVGEGDVGCDDSIPEDEYFSKLIELSLKHSSILYFPHRRESKHIKDKVRLIKNISYHDPEYPIEFEIFESKIKLSKIYGIASTAMYTLSMIYQEIPIEIIKTSKLKEILPTESYDYLVSYFNL